MRRTTVLFLLVLFVFTVSCTSVSEAPSVAPPAGEDGAHGLVSLFVPLDSSGELPHVQSFGKTILVVNQSGATLEGLYFDTSPSATRGESTNLLGDLVLPSGMMVTVSVSDLPWIADELVFETYGRVYITAFSADGQAYSRVWYPTSDLWAIVLGM